MSDSVGEILEAEEWLAAAMLAGNLVALDELLSPELVFTNHLGQVLGKEDDLAAYRSGLLEISQLDTSEQRVVAAGDVGVVSVRVQIVGTYGGQPANGKFRFTRVWRRDPYSRWRVIAAHSGVLA